MRVSRRLRLMLAVAMLPAVSANAQMLPWPTDQPRAGGGQAPWPAPAAPGPAPSPMTPIAPPPQPMSIPMSPQPMAPQPMSPQAAPYGGGGGGMPPCLAEFTKLREDVEKKGAAAKVASEHKATREEMCKQIQSYAAAEAKWVKFTEVNSASCGIPPQVSQQLKQVHGHTEQTKEKICNGGPIPGAAPPAPSLSDALGTNRLPTPDTRVGGGTLDTLTGSAIPK